MNFELFQQQKKNKWMKEKCTSSTDYNTLTVLLTSSSSIQIMWVQSDIFQAKCMQFISYVSLKVLYRKSLTKLKYCGVVTDDPWIQQRFKEHTDLQQSQNTPICIKPLIFLLFLFNKN